MADLVAHHNFTDDFPDKDRILERFEATLSQHPWLESTALRDKVEKVVNENASIPSRKRKFYRLVQEATDAVESASVCTKGCAHCCHIPVMILAGEAEALAQASGRKAVPLPIRDPRTVDREAHMGEACPFLEGNVCSVYEARPLACRLHHNIGFDASVCDVSVTNVVPMINSFRWFELGLAYLSENKEAVGDIREFFPAACEK